jgi:cholesterol transport system auxiliary component
MKVAWCRMIVVALSVPTASSCALLSPAKIETKKQVLNKIPPALPQQETRAITLLVFPPETKPIYDTTQMAYTIRPYQVAYFSRHEWSETPSRMLQPLLVRTLQNTHYFRAVLTPPYSGRYTYSLRTEILELTQDFTSEPATLQLSLRLQLSNDAANRVIATKEISLREPMQQRTPYAGVVAANDATAKALQKVAEFVLEKTD